MAGGDCMTRASEPYTSKDTSALKERTTYATDNPDVQNTMKQRSKLARARSLASLLYNARVATYLTSAGGVRAVLLMLGAYRQSICTSPFAAVAFRCLGAMVDGGPFTHCHIVVLYLKFFYVVRKCGSGVVGMMTRSAEGYLFFAV